MIYSWQAIKDICTELKQNGKTIVFTNGCFDILHAGHVSYLSTAAKFGDILILGLNSDSSVKKLKGESRPINNQDDRAKVMSALKFIDFVVVFEQDTPYQIIELIKPDVICKGGDYNAEDVVGKDIVEQYGGRVEIIPFVQGKSTTNIINRAAKND